MIQKKKWFAVYTRPKWEKKVAELLTRKNIESYCPVREVKKQWADRKKTILEPLFTSYVFVRIVQSEYVPTMETDGIISFVQWLGKPAIIKDEEIDIVRQLLNDYENVSAERKQFHSSDKVRVLNGPFEMLEGEITEVRKKTVRVLLPAIGYQLIAELEKESIEKIDS